MQIVRDLAGYSYGRSDLVRRAMSKKKADVMARERQNFVYGNEEEGVKGCINNGISEEVANHIFDEMTDFAKYAFNKSHAAAYAVVSYQTAYLKYYYPVEFMAALLTSVIDNSGKVSEYIMSARQMGIQILPPDINEGERAFSVTDKSIRYGLSAIKGLGGSVIDAIVEEREKNGFFTSLKDFATRLSGKEVNKRTIESFIKAGAFDSMPGTRKQKMMIYVPVLDAVTAEKKKNLEGQLSFFDLVSEEEKEAFEVTMPDVGEYTKEDMLAFEKEVLGIYVSGHPLQEYEELWKKNIKNTTLDFAIDEETDSVKVNDGAETIIGGMVTTKTIKTTRTNSIMAFITLEDLFGTVEVIIFPRDYEKNRNFIEEDSKIFIKGRIAVEEDKPAKLICQKIIPFEQVPKKIWLKFADMASYEAAQASIASAIASSEGNDSIWVYCEKEKRQKRIPHILASKQLIDTFIGVFGEENVKVVDSTIDKF